MLGDRWIYDRVPTERFPDYTRGNAGEVMAEPVSPLAWTFCWEPGPVQGCVDGFEQMGVFDRLEYGDPPATFGLFGGYFYNSLTQSRVFGVRSGAGWEADGGGVAHRLHSSAMQPARIVVFLPCHTLDDFPPWLEEHEADDVLAAWTAVWEPRLLAAVGRAPEWASITGWGRLADGESRAFTLIVDQGAIEPAASRKVELRVDAGPKLDGAPSRIVLSITR